MKRFFCAAAALFAALCFPFAPLAGWEPDFEVNADQVLLLNLDTGTVVYEKDADSPHAIASLTKMMTCLLLLESGEDLNTVITIPDRLEEEFQTIKDWNGVYIDLQPGEEISLEDLLYCTLLPSANDTASAIADYLSDGDIPAFVDQMNRRAGELGCRNTHFTCPHGLYDEGNYSTARDLSLIAQACLANPEFMEVATTTSFWLPVTDFHTQPQSPDAPEGYYLELSSSIQLQLPESPLYRPYARGIKTGFTDEAGRCLVTTAETQGENYLLVLLGAPNQKDENGVQVSFGTAADLLDWALDRFETGSLPETGQALASLPLNYCKEAETVEVYPNGQLSGLFWDGENPPEYRLDLPESVDAPITQGQALGTLTLYQDGQALGTLELTAGADYERSALLYWKARLGPLSGWLAGALVFLLVLALLILLRVRQVKRRRRRRRVYRR